MQNELEILRLLNVLVTDVSELKGDVKVLKEDVSVLKEKVEHLSNVTARMEFDFNNKIDALFAAYEVNQNIHKVLSNQISDLTQKFNDQRNHLIALELKSQTN